MRCVVPIPITNALLTSSDVIETTPAVYAGGTTYAAAALVYTGTIGQALDVWESLEGGNAGHTPSSSPTWWKFRGQVYGEYDGGTSYALADILQVAATHQTYESLIAGNAGNAVTDTTKWLPRGLTNKWAMFDTLRNTRTTAPLTMTVSITPGVRFNSVFVGGIVANQAEITVTSAGGGGVVYHAVQNLNTREALNHYQYCFEPFSTRAALILFDLPPYTDSVITLTLTATSGNVSCGAECIGTFEECGTILVGAEPGSLNFSTFTRVLERATLIPRPGKPLLTCTAWLDQKYSTRIANLKAATDAKLAVWAGIEGNTMDIFESVLVLGIWKKFAPVIQDGYLNVAYEIEEI